VLYSYLTITQKEKLIAIFHKLLVTAIPLYHYQEQQRPSPLAYLTKLFYSNSIIYELFYAYLLFSEHGYFPPNRSSERNHYDIGHLLSLFEGNYSTLFLYNHIISFFTSKYCSLVSELPALAQSANNTTSLKQHIVLLIGINEILRYDLSDIYFPGCYMSGLADNKAQQHESNDSKGTTENVYRHLYGLYRLNMPSILKSLLVVTKKHYRGLGRVTYSVEAMGYHLPFEVTSDSEIEGLMRTLAVSTFQYCKSSFKSI
jgi:hypothetical protein